MPKIPFDVDKNFGRPKPDADRQWKAGPAVRASGRILLLLGVLSLGYALLRDTGIV